MFHMERRSRKILIIIIITWLILSTSDLLSFNNNRAEVLQGFRDILSDSSRQHHYTGKEGWIKEVTVSPERPEQAVFSQTNLGNVSEQLREDIWETHGVWMGFSERMTPSWAEDESGPLMALAQVKTSLHEDA